MKKTCPCRNAQVRETAFPARTSFTDTA
jgi:hypothetical protein